MENLNEIKLKLIQRICESDNFYLLCAFLKNIENKAINSVSEPDSVYQNEEPMTDEEMEEYFGEEELVLPPAVLEMIQMGLDDVKHGRVHSNEEVEKFFFTELQKELIFLAEDDIKFGRTITDEEVRKLDEEWMK